MNAFRVEFPPPLRAAVTLGLVVLVFIAGPYGGRAWGQSVQPGPVPLVPQDILGAAPLAAPEVAPEQPGVTAVDPNLGVTGIEINPLAEVAPEAIGVLGAEDGGFGIDMWRGTPRGVIEGLLRRLPSRMPSRGMRDLARRLLLSAAPPPAAKPRTLASALSNAHDLPAQGSAASVQLLITRAQRLADLGEIPALISLLSVVPSHLEEESLDRLHVEALFLNGERQEACRRTRNSIADFYESAFWQKALVFCNMAGGDLDRGILGLDLLREQGVADDPLFFALANRFNGVEEALPVANTLSPLHVAMLAALEAPLPAGSLDGVAPGVLYAIATAPNVTPLDRAVAAERACVQGIVDGAALGRSYDSLSFSPEQLGNAIGAAAGLEGPRARALLYQAARRETLPAARAEVLRVALDAASRTDFYAAAVEAYGPLVAEIDPSPQMTWFAETAGRALYGARRLERANGWLTLGRQESIVNPQASAAVTALWPYSRLAGGEILAAEGGLEAWHIMREATGTEPPPGATSLLRASFRALGEADSLDWNDIAAHGDSASRLMPDAAFLYALEDASEARRIGETVLLSLIVLGEAGPAGAHSLALGTVISSLSRVGLEREARALAIEAAQGSGI